MAVRLKKFPWVSWKIFILFGVFLGVVAVVGILVFQQYRYLTVNQASLRAQLQEVKTQLTTTLKEYETLKNVDQKVRNDKLQEEVTQIQDTYKKAVATYESLLKLKEKTNKTADIDVKLADALSLLSQRNFASASAMLDHINTDIKKKNDEIAASFQIPANVAVKNEAPGSGYAQQVVKTDFGEYLVKVVAADLNSTRVVVDTASNETCKTDCPVDSLGSYAGRSGAFAGINGPYFCPDSYPSCADKKNSFDTLLMNKNKVYFNSDNNVYSTVPAVIFSGSGARFVGASQEWGRDTGVDAVIASQPMLVSGGNVVFGGDDDAKKAGKGTRSFIGVTNNTVYIGVVYNANVAEVARVLKAMGIQNALNLDSGGSTAFWSNGSYVAGPGRNTPFGILLLRK